jgi:hypothetical protein
LFLWKETQVLISVVGGAGLWDVATGSANGAISANGCQKSRPVAFLRNHGLFLY